MILVKNFYFPLFLKLGRIKNDFRFRDLGF